MPAPAVSGLWSHNGSPLQAPSRCQDRGGPASTLQRRTEIRSTGSARVPQALLHEGPFHGEGPAPWVPRPGRGLLTSVPGAHAARACGLPPAPCAHGLGPETQLSFAPRGLPPVLFFSAQSETAWRALTPRCWCVGHSTSRGWSSRSSPGEDPCVSDLLPPCCQAAPRGKVLLGTL